MKWSWKIATISGINVRLHWTMIVFLAWIGITDLANKGLSTAIYSVGVVALVFTFIVLHELGHAPARSGSASEPATLRCCPSEALPGFKRCPTSPGKNW